MNTHLANINSLPGLLGDTASEAKRPGLLARVVTWFKEMPRRSREAAELAHFSDRELADIGLSRSDLDRIQTPDFAAEYNKGRSVAMFLIRA